MFVEMGYIARMARAGTIEVLDMPLRTHCCAQGSAPAPRRRPARTAQRAVPTVTVVGAQLGWLVGGLVVVETLFNYPGIGKLMADAATCTTSGCSRRSVLVVAAIYMLANLAADVVVALLNPRVRLGGKTRVCLVRPIGRTRDLDSRGGPEPRVSCAGATSCASCCAAPRSSSGAGILLFWVFMALFSRSSRRRPAKDRPAWNTLGAAGPQPWFGTDSLGRDVLARTMAGARRYCGRPGGNPAGDPLWPGPLASSPAFIAAPPTT